MRFLVLEIRFGILARLTLVVLIAGMLTAKSAFATIYMYMDDNGQVNYTNNLSTVPVGKFNDVIKFKEYEYKAPSKNYSPTPRRFLPQSNSTDPSQQSRIKKKREQREKLEAEYNALLKKKKDMDNNKSFQKKRKKRRYHRRPYMQELIKKETEIITQLAEKKAMLKAFD